MKWINRMMRFAGLAAAAFLGGCAAEGPDLPPVFEACFEEPATRTFLDSENGVVHMHWTHGDAVSLFESTSNGKYVFGGETGANHGPFSLEKNEGFYAGFALDRNYAFYPYAAETTITEDGRISYRIPATQAYASNSFGPGAAMMVAATGSVNDKHLVFKSVVGYLVLKLYGSARVRSISLKGNAGEPLSGWAVITAGPDTDPSVAFHSGAEDARAPGTELTLDCGDLVLGATSEEATQCWLAVVPTEFSSGITVTVTDTDGNVTVQSTQKPVRIVRNVYQPMAAFPVEAKPAEPQLPDLPAVDTNLPVLYVYTPSAAPVTDKTTWIPDSHAYLKEADGTIKDLGTASIRGRGNTTWNYAKKPYAFKLDKKAGLLGMPKDKRWDLLANYLDRTRLRNDVAFELGRRLDGLAWTPKGAYVELVLNGEHLGNYYLVEHIKIAENRVAIQEMTAADVAEPAISGGYLLEMGIEMDEKNRFYTNPFPDLYPYRQNLHGGSGGTYKLPVMVKDPDEDVMVPAQLDWIRNYLNTVQSWIVNRNAAWHSCVDMDSFIDWMFVQEVVGNYEPFHPKSCYMYKDRSGKLTMGPLWDFDYGTFKTDYKMTPVYHYAIWYGYMLKDDAFVARVKERWPAARTAFKQVLDYIDRQADLNKASAEKDWARWASGLNVNGDESLSYDQAVKTLRRNLEARINQMGTEVANMGL